MRSDQKAKRLLSVRDAAQDVLSCSHDHVWRLIRSGALPIVRVGRLVRIERTDVEKFIRRQKEPKR